MKNVRIGRSEYWIASGTLVVLSCVLTGLTAHAAGGLAVIWIVLWSARLHDFGRSGYLVIAPLAAIIAVPVAAVAYGGWEVLSSLAGAAGSRSAFADNIGLVALLLMLSMQFGFMLWLGVKSGDRNANKYGPPRPWFGRRSASSEPQEDLMTWQCDASNYSCTNPAKQLQLKEQIYKEATEFSVIRNDVTIIFFKAGVVSSGPLDPEANQGYEYEGTWGVYGDGGQQEFKDQSVRQKEITEILKCFQFSWGEGRFEKGRQVPTLIKVVFGKSWKDVGGKPWDDALGKRDG